MADRSGASIASDTLSHIVLTIWSVEWSRYISFLGRVVIFPVRLAWIPLSYIAGVLAVLFAPALYMVSYFVALCNAVIAFFVGLQPLYIFFGTAAAVGIIAGIILATSSSIITFHLGMQDDSYEEPSRRLGKAPLTYSALTKDESSSNEADWYWADPSPLRRRPATGLLSQTILEEEDDSDM